MKIFRETRILLYYILLIGVLALFTSCKTTTVEDLTIMLNRDLPKGSTVEQVKIYLDSKKILHSDFRESEEDPLAIYTEENAALNAESKRIIPARIKNTKFTLTATYSILIVFYFSEDGKLIDTKFREDGTGT